MMRASSSADKLVNVTNVPDRKLRRKSSSRSVSDGRMSSGSWRMKQQDAGVAALLDAVEHHARKLEAPLLAFVALKLHLAGVAVGVDVSEGDHVVGGKPAPVDHVAHGLAVHAGDDAARGEARVVQQGFRAARIR